MPSTLEQEAAWHKAAEAVSHAVLRIEGYMLCAFLAADAVALVAQTHCQPEDVPQDNCPCQRESHVKCRVLGPSPR